MTTTSTANLWRQVRSRLLTFVPPSGTTLGTRLTGGLWYVQAPDDTPYPHAIGTLTLPTGGDYGDRLDGELELLLADRPRSQAEALEDMADLCDMALLRWADGSSGLVFSMSRPYRQALPAPLPPAEREVVMIRLVYQLVCWPEYLTQFSPFVTS